MANTAERKFETFSEKLKRRAAHCMGLSDAEWDTCKGKMAGTIVFQAVAIPTSAAAFGIATASFATGLLEFPLPAAISLGCVSAIALGVIDHQVLLQTRGDPQASKMKSWVIRIASVGMLLCAGFFVATNTHRQDIDGDLSKKRAAIEGRLSASERYKPKLEAAQQTQKMAAEDLKTANELRQKVSALQAQEAAAMEEHTNQCGGNSTKDGRRRMVGCGPLAGAALAEASRARSQAKALAAQLASMGDTQSRSTQAQAATAKIKSDIAAEASVLTRGSGMRLQALLDLIANDLGVRLSVGFFMLISLLPDMLMVIALSKNASDTGFARLYQIEKRKFEALAAALERNIRDEIGKSIPPLSLQIRRTGSARAATTPAPAAPAAQAANDTVVEVAA